MDALGLLRICIYTFAALYALRLGKWFLPVALMLLMLSNAILLSGMYFSLLELVRTLTSVALLIHVLKLKEK